MRILARYVFREFVVPLGYCMSGFVSIYVLFELFGSFSRLVESDASFPTIVGYFCGYLAPYFEYLAPAALMLATLYTMWNFCRHSELTAMRASGVSFMAIVRPLLFAAFLMALFVTWVNECYVPAHAQWAKRFRNERFKTGLSERVDNVIYRDAKTRRTWSIDSITDYESKHLTDVRVSVDRDDGSRALTVVAPKVDYIDGEWWFTEPTVRHYDSGGQEVATPTPELDALPLRVFPEFRERPSDFMMQNRDWAYNSTRDRLRYLRKHQDLSEADRQKCLYDTYAQIMSPWACLIITLFAIPAGIASGRQSVFRGILGALGMFFAFYGLTIGCMVFANIGWLPPIPAAIAPDVIFLVIGIITFRRQR